MELNPQTLKLFSISAALNLGALAAALLTIYFVGVLEGIIVFTFLVLVLPVLIYYSIFKQREQD